MKRRDFLKTAALSTAAAAVGRSAAGDAVASANPAQLPPRAYGSTGVKLSVIGFGGIVVMNAKQDHANRVVAAAVERGVNYFDVAPSYGDAEIKLGPALKPYRKDLFLACKTGERGQSGARAVPRAPADGPLGPLPGPWHHERGRGRPPRARG